MNVSRIMRGLETLEDWAKREALREPLTAEQLAYKIIALLNAAKHGDPYAVRVAPGIIACIHDMRERAAGADLI